MDDENDLNEDIGENNIDNNTLKKKGIKEHFQKIPSNYWVIATFVLFIVLIMILLAGKSGFQIEPFLK